MSTDKPLWDSPGDKVGVGGEGSHIKYYGEGPSGEEIHRVASAYFPLKPAQVSPSQRPGNCTTDNNKVQNFPRWTHTGEREPEGAVTPTRSTLVANFRYDRVRPSSKCHYAVVITRIQDELENELTAGWKIVEMARRSARAYL